MRERKAEKEDGRKEGKREGEEEKKKWRGGRTIGRLTAASPSIRALSCWTTASGSEFSLFAGVRTVLRGRGGGGRGGRTTKEAGEREKKREEKERDPDAKKRKNSHFAGSPTVVCEITLYSFMTSLASGKSLGSWKSARGGGEEEEAAGKKGVRRERTENGGGADAAPAAGAVDREQKELLLLALSLSFCSFCRGKGAGGLPERERKEKEALVRSSPLVDILKEGEALQEKERACLAGLKRKRSE